MRSTRRYHSRPRGRGRARSVNYANYETDYEHENYEYDEHDVHDLHEVFDQCVVNDVFLCTNEHSLNNDEWFVNMNVHGNKLKLEIDTGAMCNVLSLKSLKSISPFTIIGPSNILINGVHGSPVKVLGKVTLPCVYKGVSHCIDFQVLNENRNLCLLGRQDSCRFNLIARVYSVNTEQVTECEDLVHRFKDVFSDTVGCIPGQYEIKIDDSVETVVCPPRPVPAPIRQQVQDELNLLEKGGIIEKVTKPTRWVSPLVCVRKPSGRIRLCIDPTHLNKAIRREHFPMSTIDDMVTRLKGSKYFSVLDANMGFYQIKLTEKSADLTTFNTPFGRYRHLRMPMGISSAPEIYQRAMVEMFEGINGVDINMDDMLIHGATLTDHNTQLEEVLRRAQKKWLEA